MSSEEFTDQEELGDPDAYSFNRDDPDWQQKLKELIAERKDQEIRAFIADLYTADLAHLIEKFDFEEGKYLFTLSDREVQGELLLELDEHLRQSYVDDLTPTDLASILIEQQSDEAVDILSELEPEQRSQILSKLPLEERIEVTELLSYPEQTAGALMAKEYVAIEANVTVKKAIATIRKISKEADYIHTVYVIDEFGRYIGHISLSRLILARPQSKVQRLMETELLPIPVDMDREDVANFFTRYDFITCPVVDARGVLVGRITADDILEVIQEEASEDILRMGGVSSEETLRAPVFLSAAKRWVWLSVNLVTAFIASSVIGLFHLTIEKIVILASLMPIVAAIGGNAGNQAMALVIRNIALGQIPENKGSIVVYREMLLGLLNGIVMGLATGLVVFIMTKQIALSLLITTAMFFNMLVAAFAGSMVPIVLRKLKVDPAIASSIFVTALTDTMGFMIFLGLATLFIRYLTG